MALKREVVLAACALAWSVGTAAQMPPEVSPVVVETQAGLLAGDLQDGVAIFRGIPYAAPPIGALRWAAPQPVEPWPGVRSATAFEPSCPQPVDPDFATANFGGVVGAQSEDCLYLQVFAPQDAENAPVVIWFHGGAFFLGAGHLGSYDGVSNAEQGVITVSVNYRLGALANFVHPALREAAGDAPVGNYALQDSVAALEWVRDNIAAFGGDPGNVTIAGQSAGGGIVTALLSLPSAEGLFAKAVIQSGALIIPDQSPDDVSATMVAALEGIGVGPDASLADLRAISAQTFVANEALQRGSYFVTDPNFKPVSTIAALRVGNETDVPVLVGANLGEGGFNGARRLAELAGDSGAPAYLYRFAYTPGFRAEEWPNGPIHSAELMFTFDSIDTSSWGGERANAEDRAMAGTVNSCWIAFYRSPPDARGFSCAGGFEWPAFGSDGEAVEFRAGGPVVVDARPLPDGPPGQER